MSDWHRDLRCRPGWSLCGGRVAAPPLPSPVCAVPWGSGHPHPPHRGSSCTHLHRAPGAGGLRGSQGSPDRSLAEPDRPSGPSAEPLGAAAAGVELQFLSVRPPPGSRPLPPRVLAAASRPRPAPTLLTLSCPAQQGLVLGGPSPQSSQSSSPAGYRWGHGRRDARGGGDGDRDGGEERSCARSSVPGPRHRWAPAGSGSSQPELKHHMVQPPAL